MGIEWDTLHFLRCQVNRQEDKDKEQATVHLVQHVLSASYSGCNLSLVERSLESYGGRRRESDRCEKMRGRNRARVREGTLTG